MINNSQTDGLSDLADALAVRRAGWHRHQNSENGALAFFPSTLNWKDPAQVSAWESRAIETSRAVMLLELGTSLPPKPLENTLQNRVRRGD